MLDQGVHNAGCQGSVDATGNITQHSADKQRLVELCRDCDHKELRGWRVCVLVVMRI